MRVLVEIVHPADVLFFKRPIEKLQKRGDALLILSRNKDLTCDLLDDFGLPHLPVSTAGVGMIGLASELFRRDLAVWREARKFRPDVMIGFGGVAISHVTRLTGIPSVSFYDSENASLQTRLTHPFISHQYVPLAYTGPVPSKRTTKVPGTKELSYFHPSTYSPDKSRALEIGLDPQCDNFFVRVVEWRANHDIGKSGWDEAALRHVVSLLSKRGKVHLSSEADLPADLKKHEYKGPSKDVHHLVGHCRLLVGESATMASEASVLGVPAIYAGKDFPGYVRELETAGLIKNITLPTASSLETGIDEILGRPENDIRQLRDRYLARCPDWADVVLEAVDRHLPN